MKSIGISDSTGENDSISPSKNDNNSDDINAKKLKITKRLKSLEQIREKHKRYSFFTISCRRIKPIQKFRLVARAIRAFLYLRRYAKENAAKIRQEQETLAGHDILLHKEVARGWLLESIRPILISVTT